MPIVAPGDEYGEEGGGVAGRGQGWIGRGQVRIVSDMLTQKKGLILCAVSTRACGRSGTAAVAAGGITAAAGVRSRAAREDRFGGSCTVPRPCPADRRPTSTPRTTLRRPRRAARPGRHNRPLGMRAAVDAPSLSASNANAAAQLSRGVCEKQGAVRGEHAL